MLSLVFSLVILPAIGVGALPSPPASPAGDTGSIKRHWLGLPLICILGETCWVANYVDVDPSNAAHDFRCKARTYDAHDGTDFAIRDLGVMAQGVPVVASAPGIVRSVRDGMADAPITDDASRQRIAGRECGNGVVIDHEGGWQTQYCHLRRDSLRVKADDRVDPAAPLGSSACLGRPNFPTCT